MNNYLCNYITMFRILMLLGLPLLSTAQSSIRKITAKEAVQLSLQNNKQLKIANATIAEATANVKEAEDRRLPEASVSAMYLLFKQSKY